MNQGELLVRASGQEGGIAPQWRRWPRPGALVIVAVLILAPLVLVATRDAVLSGLYKESIGYRHWYSFRTVLRESDTAGRIDAFSYSLVACATLLALFAFWFGNAEQAEDPIACLFAAMQ